MPRVLILILTRDVFQGLIKISLKRSPSESIVQMQIPCLESSSWVVWQVTENLPSHTQWHDNSTHGDNLGRHIASTALIKQTAIPPAF